MTYVIVVATGNNHFSSVKTYESKPCFAVMLYTGPIMHPYCMDFRLTNAVVYDNSFNAILEEVAFAPLIRVLLTLDIVDEVTTLIKL